MTKKQLTVLRTSLVDAAREDKAEGFSTRLHNVVAQLLIILAHESEAAELGADYPDVFLSQEDDQ